jgi:hypothetical protein
MKSPQVTSGRIQKVTSGWFAGVNSVRNPWLLPENQFKWGVNIQVRGGLAQTRPGMAMRLSLPAGNFQGGIFFAANRQKTAASISEVNGVTIATKAKIFTPDGEGIVADELPYIVFAVNGSIYYAPFPLEQPKDWNEYKLSNVQMDPDVENFVFALATQSANISTGKNEIVTPSHRVVFIQDGISAPAYWDGSNKTGSQSKDIPTGTWMAFSGNRLWIANKNIVLASDLADPTSWEERKSGAGRGDFAFSRPITGLVSYVGQDTSTRLIVFTDRATFSLASGILDRSAWTSTLNFQNTLYPTVGCVAGKSIAFQAGQMWWYSQGGLVAADVAAASYLSSQVLYKDVEMARTKRFMAGDNTKICSASFENYILISVPHLERLNSETMVLDYAAASEWTSTRTPAWCGVWTGTRPIEWTTGTVGGQQRCFHFSVDYAATTDGSYNHLWECFVPQKYDSYLEILPDGSTQEKKNRIYSQIETAQMGDGMDYKQFIYAEIETSEIGGITDVSVSFRGSKGKYKEILHKRLLAVTDEFQWRDTPYEEEIQNLGYLQTQYRRLITETAQRTADYTTCENEYSIDIDKAFSILIEWCGQLGVEIIRVFMDPYATKALGVPQKDETKYCVVGQGGENIVIDSLPDRYAQTDGSQKSWYAQISKTINLECPAPSLTPTVAATATASFLSFINYEHAEAEASKLAEQAAIAAAQEYRTQNPCE